jgi:hypothetical protein
MIALKRVIALALLLAVPHAARAVIADAADQSVPVDWMDKRDPPASRAAKLLAKMTLDEKLGMLHGNKSAAAPKDSGYVGFVPGE